jgi:DNA polymerase I-like protein with 3'-5' exonuclease and polymerase domains
MQGSLLLDTVDTIWAPPDPPSLTGCPVVALDVETTGLRWWDGDRPIGISVTYGPQQTRYLPFGHRGGGNLDAAAVRRWCQRELRSKHLVGLNTRFDIHMMRAWGIDLEAQGCTASDVSHTAALLNDRRQRFSLDALAQEFLGVEKTGKDLDATRMADYSAGMVAPRAEADTRLVWQLRDYFAPLIARENLERVQALEDQVIWVVCEMERNGTPIDVELLDRWIYESHQQYLRGLWGIHRETGLTINPASPHDLEKLFAHLNLPLSHTPDGRPSFTDAVLATHPHPVMDIVRTTRKLASLRSKYLLKYKKSLGADGILRYALHQLRATGGDGRSAGTCSGRFSSTAIARGEGINIQQVMGAEKQREAFGDRFLIRRLHRPAEGLWLSADAAQIEYRLFAHEAQNPRVLRAYQDDPSTSFHRLVWDEVRKLKPDVSYKQQKNLNFARLYGAGTIKIAHMLDLITEEQVRTLRAERATAQHPDLAGARDALAVYARVLPEVGSMLKRASLQAQRTGYVTTLLGRRARLTERHYSALNRQIQGSAADLMKLKLVALHSARKDTGFLIRCTVHDEVDGDVPDADSAARVAAILDTQSLPLRVPITWNVGTGATWGDV